MVFRRIAARTIASLAIGSEPMMGIRMEIPGGSDGIRYFNDGSRLRMNKDEKTKNKFHLEYKESNRFAWKPCNYTKLSGIITLTGNALKDGGMSLKTDAHENKWFEDFCEVNGMIDFPDGFVLHKNMDPNTKDDFPLMYMNSGSAGWELCKYKKHKKSKNSVLYGKRHNVLNAVRDDQEKVRFEEFCKRNGLLEMVEHVIDFPESFVLQKNTDPETKHQFPLMYYNLGWKPCKYKREEFSDKSGFYFKLFEEGDKALPNMISGPSESERFQEFCVDNKLSGMDEVSPNKQEPLNKGTTSTIKGITFFELKENMKLRKLENLGVGGFASVNKVKNVNDKKLFALKLYNPHSKSGWAVEKDFLLAISKDDSEGTDYPRSLLQYKGHGQIQHEKKRHGVNPVQYYYVLLDFRKDSAELRNMRSRFNFLMAKKFLEDMMKALFFMKKHHYYHMDIKPANILAINDGKDGFVLIDYNCIVHHNSEFEKKDVTCGTPVYMPREVNFKIKNAGFVSKDFEKMSVFSLGLTLYKAITGRMARSTNNGPVTEARKIVMKLTNSAFPLCFRQLLSDMMENEPINRPTFDDIQSRLEGC